jgi:hypothetical protein
MNAFPSNVEPNWEHPTLSPFFRQFLEQNTCHIDMNGVALNKRCMSQSDLGNKFFEWLKQVGKKVNTNLNPSEVGALIYQHVRRRTREICL